LASLRRREQNGLTEIYRERVNYKLLINDVFKTYTKSIVFQSERNRS